MINDLQKLVEQLGIDLKSRSQKLATAESCTGGGLGYWITSVSGSSEWYDCGFITYSNNSKITMLGVSSQNIAQYGAVSEQVACDMAIGALLKSQAQLSVAITGIAGPLGGSADKPVGTVWIAWATLPPNNHAHTVHTKLYNFQGNRSEIILQAIRSALDGLLN